MAKGKKADKTLSTKDPEIQRLIYPETAAEKMRRERISLLLLEAELILVDARNYLNDDSKPDFLVGEALKKVQKIQELGGWKPLEF